jgi:hypothetical protein
MYHSGLLLTCIQVLGDYKKIIKKELFCIKV